ncbi:MAG: TolC family protein [Bacteroidaceae bacterium]|nr:TolC family protein [Bacteroidaceae bacterium]
MKRSIYIMVCLLGMTTSISAQSSYTLQQIKSAALEHNISIRSARLDLESASQQRKEAFTKYFPTISGTGAWFNANRGMAKMDFDLSKSLSPTTAAALAQSLPPEVLADLASPMSMTMMKNGTIAGVTAMQPVFAGGQIVNGNKLAKVGEEVSKLQLRLSEDEVEKGAEQYFWQIVSLEEKLKTVNAVQEMLNDIYKDVNAAVNAGVALRNDLLQVQLRQNEVESQKLTLTNNLKVLHLTLAQYCGLSDSDFTLTYDTEAVSPLSLHEDPEQALSGTAEYQLLTKQVEATKLQQRMAVGQNLPTVAVGAGYNYHNLMENDRTFGMVFATVNIPISDWWGGSHAIKQKRIAKQKAEEQLEDTAELLKIRMTKAWNDVEEAYLQVGIAERSVEQSSENLRIHRDYYRAGTATMSDLLEAQLLYQQAQDKHIDAYAAYQNKILEYCQAIGALH